MGKVLKKDLTQEQKDNIQAVNEAVKRVEGEGVDAEQFYNETVQNMKSNNYSTRANAYQKAADFTSQLAMLILYQEIEKGLTDLTKYDWINRFSSGFIREGNSVELVKYLNTGNENFDPDKFIPNEVIKPLIESKIISMYVKNAQGDVELSEHGYQYKKPLTIQDSLWIPYFTGGNLMVFVSRIRESMVVSYKLFLINKFEQFITNLTLPEITPSAEATDMFTSLSNDVFPAIEEMQYLGTKFNLDANSKVIDAVKREDLLMIVNYKLYSKIRTGMQSRLFNAKLIDLASAIPQENIIAVKGSVNPAGVKDVFTTGNDWLGEDEIILIDKNAIRHYLQIDLNSSQAYAENMTLMLYLHVWGTIDYVPWLKGAKYKNPNLTKLPA